MSKAIRIFALVAAAAGAAIAYKKFSEKAERADDENKAILYRAQEQGNRQAYIVGGGLGSLAAAAYLVRDCGFEGKNIHVFEGLHLLGGANDGCGDAQHGFLCRGGRMLNEETYENFWELFSTIPSPELPGRSVTEEILAFDAAHPTHARARLVDKDGGILDVRSMGFTQKERLALGRLLVTPEEKLDDMTIADWFAETPHFFETNFWHMWQTTFAFQTWSSLFEFRRYMNRMILEFPRIETLEGVTRCRYNQYDSVILPLQRYLEAHGVELIADTTVTDLDFAEEDGITVSALHCLDANGESSVKISPDDICIVTTGGMCDSSTLGDYSTPAPVPEEKAISGELWAKMAAKKPGLGNPYPFFEKTEETNWESFTVTSRGNRLLKLIESFSGNIPGSGALMTFKDSSWKMSIVVAAQPHFKNQPMDVTVFWGYGLYTDRIGDYVHKPMKDCTGEEILTELMHQLHMEDQLEAVKSDIINVIPCYMPYVDAHFEPRKMSDRPQVVPAGSTNLGLIGQYVETPEDMVFTEEYSVRTARIAVYTLLGIDRKICPVTPYNRDPKVLATALKTAYR